MAAHNNWYHFTLYWYQHIHPICIASFRILELLIRAVMIRPLGYMFRATRKGSCNVVRSRNRIYAFCGPLQRHARTSSHQYSICQSINHLDEHGTSKGRLWGDVLGPCSLYVKFMCKPPHGVIQGADTRTPSPVLNKREGNRRGLWPLGETPCQECFATFIYAHRQGIPRSGQHRCCLLYTSRCV